jgi:pimeloyl-ACP methyl ester carboxylesterase
MNFPSFKRCSTALLSMIVGSAIVCTPLLARGASVHVEPLKFPVQLSTGQDHSFAGFLFFKPGNKKNCFKKKKQKQVLKCLRKGLKNRTLQVLVHGFSYNHTYWDTKRINGVDYSYARFMANQGFDVLALDSLGTGASSIPDGDVLNIDESASALAQVLTSLRSKKNNPINEGFQKIALVGHSLGTVTAVFTLGMHTDAADVLVATGWSYAPHEVLLDPMLIGQALRGPDSFFQFPSEERERLFYFLDSADLDVIAFDNANLADQFPRGFLTQGLPLLQALALGDIEQFHVGKVAVPVLIQLGEFDLLIAPPRFPDLERKSYAGSSDVTFQRLKSMGHSFNLHENNMQSWTRIDQWIKQRLGKKTRDHSKNNRGCCIQTTWFGIPQAGPANHDPFR